MPSILLLPGDGQGPGAIAAAEAAISAAAENVEIVRGDIGFSGYEKHGSALPHETLDLISGCDAALCGPTSDFNDGDTARNPLEDLIGQLRPYAVSVDYRTLADDLGARGVDVTVWGCGSSPNSEVSETRGIDGITVSKYIRSTFYARMMDAAAGDCERDGCVSVACIASPDMFPESSDVFFEAFREAFDRDGTERPCLGVAEWFSEAYRSPDRFQCLIVADLCVESVRGAVAGITGRADTAPERHTGEFGSLYTVSKDTGCKNGSDIVSAIDAASHALRDIGETEAAATVAKALGEAVSNGERPVCMGGALEPWTFAEKVVARVHSLISGSD